ncbi:unnamed protein product [Didymodactylos carnosus]|uniref:Uncharacterized protein n=1 Tax=Didymodactylos carnosus TaxID=1234261 RepID=A0A8S2CQ36_9BILA|nr:unnamed protein product [Didymodactylos carnosus]CAF3555856.1 unnamed protein product [Didymodactylos carnosus]
MKGQQGQTQNYPSYANKNAVERDLNKVYNNEHNQMNREGQNKRTNEFSDEEVMQIDGERYDASNHTTPKRYRNDSRGFGQSRGGQQCMQQRPLQQQQQNNRAQQKQSQQYQSKPSNERNLNPQSDARFVQPSLARTDNVADQRERQDHGNNAQFEISTQVIKFAVEQQYVPIKPVCQPKV